MLKTLTNLCGSSSWAYSGEDFPLFAMGCPQFQLGHNFRKHPCLPPSQLVLASQFGRVDKPCVILLIESLQLRGLISSMSLHMHKQLLTGPYFSCFCHFSHFPHQMCGSAAFSMLVVGSTSGKICSKDFFFKSLSPATSALGAIMTRTHGILLILVLAIT